MFTFIQTKQNAHITKKWERFIQSCTEKYNAAGIPIDSCYLQSIIIQKLYTTYLIQVNTLFYGFDYSKPCIEISDISFWKVCKMKWNNGDYLFHKCTHAVFQVQNELIWVGIFDFNANKLVCKEECPIFVRKWYKECKFA